MHYIKRKLEISPNFYESDLFQIKMHRFINGNESAATG